MTGHLDAVADNRMIMANGKKRRRDAPTWGSGRRRRRPLIVANMKSVAARRLRQLESFLVKNGGGGVDCSDSGGSCEEGLFACPVCRGVLDAPVTLVCGHTVCSGCLCDDLRDDVIECAVCDNGDDFTRPCVNVVVQEIVLRWRLRQENQDDPKNRIPNIADILGVEPRYRLRSRYAGLLHLEGRKKHENHPLKNRSNNLTPIQDHDLLHLSARKFTATLRRISAQLQDVRKQALRTSWGAPVTVASDLECVLCSRCYLDPVTTGCGHTFCRGCVTRVLDHGLACPLCMAPLGARDYARGTNLALDRAIRVLFPHECDERLAAHLKEVKMLGGRNSDVPVFICTNAFPGVACPLYVYEPRYRLMVRRCLDSSLLSRSGSRKFAMLAKQRVFSYSLLFPDWEERLVSFGTILEVKDAVRLEDGSFILATLGVRRFKVLSRGEQDGYDTAKIQIIKDVPTSRDKMAHLLELHEKVHTKAIKWISSLSKKVLAEVERLIGKMPEVERNWYNLPDGPAWTWWLMPILPLSSTLQVGFLSTIYLEKRLRAIDKMLEHMEIKMKALERSSGGIKSSCPTVLMDYCTESERTFQNAIRLNGSNH